MAEAKTIIDMYHMGLRENPKPNAFRRKVNGTFVDVPSAEYAETGRGIARGLTALGLGVGDRVAVLSETRLEWGQADLGILSAGLVSVPIYPTLPEAKVAYILDNSESKIGFASTVEQVEKLLAYREQHPEFQIVAFDDAGAGADGVVSLADLVARGASQGNAELEVARRIAAASSDDLATIIYTSGTTGPPKGVMLSHGNLTSNVVAGLKVLQLRSTDSCLSFLPLSHIFERMVGLYCMVYTGVSISYAESFETVPADMLMVRPTLMVSVPRLYEKIYARVVEAASSAGGVKKNLFYWAQSVGLTKSRAEFLGKSANPWVQLQFSVADKLVFSKLRARVGGRLRFFVSGGAPLNKDIAEFFYAAGLPILEGYGLTETSPVITVNPLDAIRPGTVGKTLPGVEVKIAEDGEILAKGPNIMLGYYRMPDETAVAIRDGWFYTGDIGHFNEDGYLVITDRKKDLIVTAGGKNVAPQPIENALKTDPFISEVVLIGDRKPYLVALIVPNFEMLNNYAKLKGLSASSNRDLVRNERVLDLMHRRLLHLQEGSAGYETIRKFHLLDRELSIGDGELTPTLKIKRKEVAARFEKEIEALYEAD